MIALILGNIKPMIVVILVSSIVGLAHVCGNRSPISAVKEDRAQC
jgi:hypothetical protein